MNSILPNYQRYHRILSSIVRRRAIHFYLSSIVEKLQFDNRHLSIHTWALPKNFYINEYCYYIMNYIHDIHEYIIIIYKFNKIYKKI